MRNRHNYSENWNDEIRPRILKRDKFKCQNCGVKHRKSYLFLENGTYIEIDKEELQEAKANGERAYTVFLQVAHLDHNPQNNDENNLKSLCPKCHLKNDKEFNKLARKSKKQQ